MSRVVIITGASGGLGQALAGEFASNDWQVVGMGRSARPAGLDGKVVYRQFDASDAEACEAFWKDVREEYADASVCLINNAGGYVQGGLRETTPDDYASQMKSCYFSAVYMMRGLALAVPEARIINVISSSALSAHKNNSAYGAAKAAEMHFFQSLQQEFDAKQYQITNLYPFNIASHGPADNAMSPNDLAVFIRQQAESGASYYLRDVTIWPK